MSVPVVAIDARMTRQMSVGMKRYVSELVLRLPKVAPDMRFIAVTNAALDVHPDLGVVRIGEKSSVNGSLGEMFALPKLMASCRPSAGHYTTPYAPRWSPFPYVYTIHDLIHRRYPQYHSWKIPPYYALLVGPVARGARLVTVMTKATVPDLQTYLGVPAERARVVPLGVSEKFRPDAVGAAGVAQTAQARERFGLSRPFFLYAGNHRRHKNLETMAAGWSKVSEACDLAITEDGPFDFEIDRYVKANGRIVRLGHVGERDLAALYAACSGAIQPSLYEGFGLSVIEAMAAGAPCAIAQTPALLEVAGGAALTFPPRDADALAQALSTLLRDAAECARLREAGMRRAAGFSWDETARGTAAAYREVIY